MVESPRRNPEPNNTRTLLNYLYTLVLIQKQICLNLVTQHVYIYASFFSEKHACVMPMFFREISGEGSHAQNRGPGPVQVRMSSDCDKGRLHSSGLLATRKNSECFFTILEIPIRQQKTRRIPKFMKSFPEMSRSKINYELTTYHRVSHICVRTQSSSVLSSGQTE